MANPIKVIKSDHIVLNVQNLETSLHFYAEVLGMSVERLEEYQAGKAPFPSVRMGEQLIDLFPPNLSKAAEFSDYTHQRVNHFCVCISAEVSISEIETYLQEKGVQIKSRSNRNFGAFGYGPSLYILDPDANIVELKQYFQEV